MEKQTEKGNPAVQYRAVKVYLPAREDIPFFREFVDFCAHYDYNQIVMEVGGAMAYHSHPEINAGWVEYCKRFAGYQGQSLDVQNEPRWARNSIHMENAGGGFLTQDEVRELVSYCRSRGLEVTPEMPSLSHCDYLLYAHPELRERAEDDLPDTYCPSNPASYALLFELLDEVLAVFEPKQLHIGHDELLTVCRCGRCAGRDAAELFAEDVVRIHDYLAERGVQTVMWGDKLLNAIGKKGQTWGGSRRVIVHQRTGDFLEELPATWRAIDLIPRDILIYHWYWSLNREWEDEFLKRGFPVVLANFSGMAVRDWDARAAKGVEGVSISNWSVLNRDHLQRNDVLFNICYTARLLRDGGSGSFEQDALAAAHDMFRYRTEQLEHYLLLIHRTSVYKEHVMFVDGYMIDREDDYLGKYVISLSGGDVLEIPLYYNLNIGPRDVDFQQGETTDVDGIKYNSQIFEATYTCDLLKTEQGLFYALPVELPAEQQVTELALVEDSKYSKNVELVGIKWHAGGVDSCGE